MLRFPARSRWPDGSNAANPLNGCRGGRGGLFVFSEFRGDFEPEAGLRLAFVEKGGEAEHVQWKTARVSAGDDQAVGLIRLVSVGNYFGKGEGRLTSAVAVDVLSVPVDIVADASLAGLFEVFGLDDDMDPRRLMLLDFVFVLSIIW